MVTPWEKTVGAKRNGQSARADLQSARTEYQHLQCENPFYQLKLRIYLIFLILNEIIFG